MNVYLAQGRLGACVVSDYLRAAHGFKRGPNDPVDLLDGLINTAVLDR